MPIVPVQRTWRAFSAFHFEQYYLKQNLHEYEAMGNVYILYIGISGWVCLYACKHRASGPGAVCAMPQNEVVLELATRWQCNHTH